MEREQTMTDHAEIVREQLRHLGARRGAVGEEALDALVAELKAANADWHRIRDLHADAVSEVARLMKEET